MCSNGHTSSMTLKNASVLTLIGTFMVTILVGVNFFNTILGVSRDIVPAMALLPCFVYFFTGVAMTVFFWIFSRRQD